MSLIERLSARPRPCVGEISAYGEHMKCFVMFFFCFLRINFYHRFSLSA